MRTGWVVASLADISRVVRDRVNPRRVARLPFVGMEDVEGQTGRLLQTTPAASVRSAAVHFFPADVLYGRLRPYLNKVLAANFEGLSSAEFIPLTPPTGISSRFLQYRLLSTDFVHFASHLNTGDRPRVDFDQLANFRIALPPSEEQGRIVSVIESYFSRLDDARALLGRVQRNLRRYRAAVLKAAVEGRLIFRATEASADAGTYSRALRELPPKAAQTRKKRAGRLWGSGTVPMLTDEERQMLPAGWRWVKVRDLAPTSADEVVQVGPMSMRSADFADDGIPVLNVGSIKWDRIDESKVHFLPARKAAQFSRYMVRQGDVLFTRSGTVGRSAVAQGRHEGWLMTFHLLRARLDPNVCSPGYLRIVFEGAPHVRRQTREASIGTTRAGFNTNLLANLDIPLPSTAEQAEIVCEVERLLSESETISQQVHHALQRTQMLRRAVLRWAFEGRLVDQDPADEPAGALLDRIRLETAVEKASQDATQRSARRQRRSTMSDRRAEETAQ